MPSVLVAAAAKVEARDIQWGPWYKNSASSGSGITYLINEQCESGQGSWTTPSGETAANYAYNTSPAPLKGSFSFAATGNTHVGNRTFTPGGIIEAFCYLVTTSLANQNFPFGLVDDNQGTNNCAYVTINTTGKIQVGGQANTATTVGVMSINTTYGVWVRYAKGTGSNAFMSVEFQPSPFTRVGSGNNFTSLSNGTDTINAGAFQFSSFAATGIYILDNILVAANQTIPSNPP